MYLFTTEGISINFLECIQQLTTKFIVRYEIKIENRITKRVCEQKGHI